jgi:hypothetical protein
MILGRSPNIVLGFLTAAFNAIVIFHLNGFAPTVEQTAAVNVLLGAGVLLIANTSELAVAAGVKAIARMNNTNPTTSHPGTDLANKVIGGDGLVVTNVAPTPKP